MAHGPIGTNPFNQRMERRSTGQTPGPARGEESRHGPPLQHVARGGARNVWVFREDIHVSWVPGNGWNVVMNEAFTDILHLFRQINQYREGGEFLSADRSLHNRIQKLGIFAHGGERSLGTVMMNPAVSAESVRSASRVRHVLQVIGNDFLTPNAEVSFWSCSAASGDGGQGTELLKALSSLWPGRTVVGFVTHGYVSSLGNTSAGNVTNTLVSYRTRNQPPSGLPRFDINGPSAKHARNGNIIKWPEPDELWRLYQELNPNGARLVRQRAQRRRVDPYLEYATTAAGIDVNNPNHPSRLQPLPPTSH